MRRQIRNGYSCISYSRVLNGMKTILNSRYGKSIEPPLLGKFKSPWFNQTTWFASGQGQIPAGSTCKEISSTGTK